MLPCNEQEDFVLLNLNVLFPSLACVHVTMCDIDIKSSLTSCYSMSYLQLQQSQLCSVHCRPNYYCLLESRLVVSGCVSVCACTRICVFVRACMLICVYVCLSYSLVTLYIRDHESVRFVTKKTFAINHTILYLHDTLVGINIPCYNIFNPGEFSIS